MAFFAIAEVWPLKPERISVDLALFLLIFHLAGSPVLKEKMEMLTPSNLKKKKKIKIMLLMLVDIYREKRNQILELIRQELHKHKGVTGYSELQKPKSSLCLDFRYHCTVYSAGDVGEVWNHICLLNGLCLHG